MWFKKYFYFINVESFFINRQFIVTYYPIDLIQEHFLNEYDILSGKTFEINHSLNNNELKYNFKPEMGYLLIKLKLINT